MREYGVFEDGACIEAGFHGESGKAAAEEHAASLAAADPEMAGAYVVQEVCPDHEEQPKDGCEECATDGDDEPAEIRRGHVGNRVQSHRVNEERPAPYAAAAEALCGVTLYELDGAAPGEIPLCERCETLAGDGEPAEDDDETKEGEDVERASTETDALLKSWVPSREASLRAARRALSEMPDKWREDPAYWVGQLGQALEDVMHHVDAPTAEVSVPEHDVVELHALRGFLGQLRTIAEHGKVGDVRTALVEYDQDTAGLYS